MQIELNESQVKLLLRVLDEEDPEFNYRELAELSIVRSDLTDLKEHGEIRWRAKAEAAKKIRDEAKNKDTGKPTKSFKQKMYVYSDVIRYIEQKYDIQTRGYKEDIAGPDGQKEYRDFWHWLLKFNDVYREGCSVNIPEDWRPEDGPWWVTEILDLIVKEFFPGHNWDEDFMEFWVSW